MNNKNEPIAVFGVLGGVLLLTFSLFLMFLDLFIHGSNFLVSLLSKSFYLALSIIIIIYAIIAFRKVNKKIRAFLTSFVLSYLVLIIFLITTLIYASLITGEASIKDSPFIVVLFLFAIFTYSLFSSFAELIYRHTKAYIIIFTILLSVVLFISLNYYWCVFTLFLVFLIIRISASFYLKEKNLQ
jgi:hypothetical protein